MHGLFVCCGDPDPTILGAFGRFVDWFRAGVGPGATLEEIDARRGGLESVSLERFDAVIVSGSSHAAYEPHPWIPGLEQLIRNAVQRDLPLLGVCFGHQVAAQALGGKVVRNPRGREIGTAQLRINDEGRRSAMLGAFGEAVDMQVTHCDTVIRPPAGAKVLATSALDDCQAFEYRSAWCSQFHPEITATVIRAYLESRRKIIAGEGLDPDALIAAVRESDAGHQLLKRFVAWAGERRG